MEDKVYQVRIRLAAEVVILIEATGPEAAREFAIKEASVDDLLALGEVESMNVEAVSVESVDDE